MQVLRQIDEDPWGPPADGGRVIHYSALKFPLVKATPYSSGWDLPALLGKDITLYPKEIKLIPTGITIELPPYMEAQVRPRSGLALKHGITVLNSPGTIDSDYRGEIGVILINHSRNPFTIRPGDRIAQLVFSEVTKVHLTKVEDISRLTGRGEGGFGSSGGFGA